MAYVTLYANVPLNNTYKNIIRFKSELEIDSYLNNYLVGNGGTGTSYNFVPQDVTGVGAILTLDTSSSYTFTELTTANYLAVVFANDEYFGEVVPFSIGYYFINNIKINNAQSVTYTLELDVATTYALGSATTLEGELLTKRKHCNRFSTDTYGFGSSSYNMFDDTYANNGDELDSMFTAQYPTKRIDYVQNTNPYNEQENISSTLTRDEVLEYIQGYEWEMLITTEPINESLSYFTFPDTYDVTSLTIHHESFNVTFDYEETRVFNSDNDITTGVYVYVYPKYGNNVNKMTMNDIYTNLETLKLPVMYNDDNANVTFLKEPKISSIATIVSRVIIPHNFVYSLIGRYAEKKTIRVPYTESPFYRAFSYVVFNFIDTSLQEDEMTNIVPSAQENNDVIYSTTLFGNNYRYAIQLQLTDIDYNNELCWTYENTTDTFYEKFKVSSLSVNNEKNMNLEPKLFKPPYSRYYLKSLMSSNEGFEINPLISGPQISVISKFVPSPGLLRFTMYPNAIWKTDSSINMLKYINVGNISTMDYSLPVKIDKYAEYIAERKNYAISGLVTPVVNSTLVSGGTLALTAALNPGGMMSSLAGSLIGVSSGVASAMNYIANTDNLINAPDSVRSLGNDALSDFGLNVPLTPYIAVYELSECQKKQVFDYYYRYGYLVNDYNTWDELFTRQRFNYIQLNDDELYHKIVLNRSGWSNSFRVNQIPSSIRNIIVNIFTNGVTIWESKYSDMNLEYENLEIGIGSDS